MVSKLASAIWNDVVAGLVGMTSTPTISIEQLEQDVIDERLQIIKEYSLKNLIPVKDLIMAIRCITPSKESIEKCPVDTNKNLTWHFEIPQLINDFGEDAIEFIGTSDRKNQYKVYLTTSFQYHQYKRRACNSPYVYIDTAPNCNNMYDCWLFNTSSAKLITVSAIFKDPRQMEGYPCCANDDLENYTFISTEIKKRLTEKKLRFYRQFYQNPTPNNQAPK